VSIDIDVLDMPLVPGCGSGEAAGLDYEELRSALAYVAAHHEVVGFDLVEVNPLLDVPARNTSYLAAQIVTEFMGCVVENPAWRSAHHVEDGWVADTNGATSRRANGRLARGTGSTPPGASIIPAAKTSKGAGRAAPRGRT
jgi:hypothetical protein